MVLLGCSRSKVILGVLTEVKEASNKDKWVRKKYMGVDSGAEGDGGDDEKIGQDSEQEDE